tara:strand:+ start:2583 stop:2804 length:222 start_codon:yes stop_codon:yes gene_type:complete
MTFKLVHKGKDEAIDRVTLSDNHAKQYFMNIKRLSEKEFDKIFEVKRAEDFHKPNPNYKWWHEESKNLDIDKE